MNDNGCSPLPRRIRTVLHDDQRFSDTEFDLLHTPALQRLYDLHQLGLTDRVFLDASHSRLHHVIGVIEQADKIMDAIIANLRKRGHESLPYGKKGDAKYTRHQIADIARRRKPAVRLMGLLHDLPHAPYGHTLEDEIRLVDVRHDEPARQADAFYRLVIQYFGWIERNRNATDWGAADGKEPTNRKDHPAWLEWYLDAPSLRTPPQSDEFISFLARRWKPLFQKEPNTMRRVTPAALEQFTRDLAFATRALLYLDIAHSDEKTADPKYLPEDEYLVHKLLKAILHELGRPLQAEDEFQPRRDVFLLDVIGNTICADLLDYARRDALNAGLKIDYDPIRIASNMTVIPWHTPPFIVKGSVKEYPFSHRCLRAAISVFSHKLRTDMPGELINLLQARYFVYERMLFHPTKCVAGALLGSAVQFIGWRRIPKHLCFAGDAVFLHQIEEAAKIVRDLLASEKATDLYTRLHATRFTNQLVTNSETAVAAKAVLNDRVLSVETLRRHLFAMKNFPQHSAAASACLDAIPADADGGDIDEAEFGRLENALKGDTAAVKLLQASRPTIESIRADMRASLRLLARLRARRYHKIIFRMLPDVQVVGLHDLTVEDIADKFLNPHIRKIAEREIERRLDPSLPLGSIVIHCPPAAGPAKIANILITDDSTDEDGCPRNAARLRDIGKVNSKIFGEHEKSVTALEKMYQSTWRLAVSVARPHEARWQEIKNITSKVLFEILSGGDVLPGQVPNDRYLDRELELQTAPRQDRDGFGASDGQEQPAPLATKVLAAVKASARFDDLLRDAESFDQEAFRLRLDGAAPVADVRPIDHGQEADLFPTVEAAEQFLRRYINPSELTKTDKPRYKKLTQDLPNLGVAGSRFTRTRIKELLPDDKIEYNRPMLDELIKIVAEAKGYDEPAPNK